MEQFTMPAERQYDGQETASPHGSLLGSGSAERQQGDSLVINYT